MNGIEKIIMIILFGIEYTYGFGLRVHKGSDRESIMRALITWGVW
jgi:hypothetical protein